MMKNQNKIFKSLFFLNFKDKKLEKNYINKGLQNSSIIVEKILNFLMGYIVLTCILEFQLIIKEENSTNKNLRWNFYFCIGNLAIYHLNNYFMYSKILNQNLFEVSPYSLFLSKFIVIFCLLNNNMSLISILVVYFKANLETLSVTFCFQMMMKFCVSFFLIKGFYYSLLIILINISIQYIFLLSLHVIKAVYIYIFTELVFSFIVLTIVYLSEYYTRVFFHSYNRLEKEKEYNLETLKFFNISYFKSKNYSLTYQMKMEELLTLRNNSITKHSDSFEDFEKLESLLNSYYIFSEIDLPKVIENYVKQQCNQKSFTFRGLVELLQEQDLNIFSGKFTKFGVFHIKKDKEVDDLFLEMYLNIKIKNSDSKNKTKKESDKYKAHKLYNKIIKIEGMFIDVTQTITRKKTQVNSLILSKYIHDIKTPLFLLKHILNDYKQTSVYLFNKVEQIFKVYENKYESVSTPLKMQSTMSEMKNQTDSVKLISSHVFKLIESINLFTKQQNLIASSDENRICAKESLSKFDIRKLIGSVVDFYKISAKYNPKKASINVFSDIDNTVPDFILANKEALQQVLMNLLSNSMKFTNKGSIKIKAHVKTKFEFEDINILELAVIDTGVGIDDLTLPKLCSPYSFSTDLKSGSGLGLSIVKDCLFMMGSKLNIYSKKNQGSTFSFELNLRRPEKNNKNLIKSFVSSSDDEEIVRSQDISINNLNEIVDKLDDSKVIDNDNDKVNDNDNDSVKTTYNDTYPQKNSSMSNVLSTSCKKQFQLNYDKKSDGITLQLEDFRNLDEISKIEANYNSREKESRMEIDDFNKLNRRSDLSIIKEKVEEGHNSNLISSKNLKIILIDDDSIYSQQLCRMIKSILKDLGFDTTLHYATNPIEGLSKMYSLLSTDSCSYDIMLIDEHMPYLNGTAFIEFYKTLIPQGFYNIPVISISGEISSNKVNTPYDYIINKPCNRVDLKNILNRILTNLDRRS